jgi:hypothetical protein
MYSGKIAVPPGGGGIVENSSYTQHEKRYFPKSSNSRE